MTSEAGSLFLEPEKKLYGCTRANCKQTEILVKDLTTHDEARGVKLYAPYCVCLSLSADPVWMINSMLPSLAANSNNKYFQNIVTWSTTSRTLLAYFKLSARFLCRQYLPVASIPTYLKKDKNKYAKSELSTATHTISLRYFLVLYVTSVILLSIVKQIHGEEKWKTNVVTLVTELFSFISRDQLIVNVLYTCIYATPQTIWHWSSQRLQWRNFIIKWRRIISQRPDIE